MRRSSKSWAKVKNLLFGKVFAENCMKMKEMGPTGDARPWVQIDLIKDAFQLLTISGRSRHRM